jgi:hypothetical protein
MSGDLNLERPAFRPLFAEGKVPTSAAAWDHKWPVLVDLNELSETFRDTYESGANYESDPFEGPIYHAAKALADRHKTFFDLFRGRAPQVIADGTTTTGVGVVIQGAQWNHPHRSVDVRLNDVWCNFPRHVMWSGVTLRRAIAPSVRTPTIEDIAAEPARPWPASMSNDSWISDIVKWLSDVRSAGREDVPWAEVTERIEEAWLRMKAFGPPSVSVGLLRGKIAEASNNDRPTPGRPRDVPATPPLPTASIGGGPPVTLSAATGMRSLRRPKAAPKAKQIETVLKARGFDRDRQGKSYRQIAYAIGDDVGMGSTGQALDAVTKRVERCLKRLEKEKPR